MFFTRWPPSIFISIHHLFCCAPSMMVCTQHFVWWACHIVVVSCHLDRQPAFIWWAHGILVSTWHLFWWAACVSFGGHLAFWVPPRILVAPSDFFGGYVAFGDNLASCWAPSIYFAGHIIFWCADIVSCGGHPVLLWWAPCISFGVHGAFLWPPGILGIQHLFC